MIQNRVEGKKSSALYRLLSTSQNCINFTVTEHATKSRLLPQHPRITRISERIKDYCVFLQKENKKQEFTHSVTSKTDKNQPHYTNYTPFSHHFLPKGRGTQTQTLGHQSNNPSFFHLSPHLPPLLAPLQTLSRASHENTWGKGMEEGGKRGGDRPYSLEEGVIHSSVCGRK